MQGGEVPFRGIKCAVLRRSWVVQHRTRKALMSRGSCPTPASPTAATPGNSRAAARTRRVAARRRPCCPSRGCAAFDHAMRRSLHQSWLAPCASWRARGSRLRAQGEVCECVGGASSRLSVCTNVVSNDQTMMTALEVCSSSPTMRTCMVQAHPELHKEGRLWKPPLPF